MLRAVGDGQPIAAALWEELLNTPPRLFGILPVVAAISAGLAFVRKGALRSAALMCVVISLALVVIDLATPRAIDWPPNGVGITGEAALPSSPSLDFLDTQALVTLVQAVRGDLPGSAEILRTYMPGHPRFVMTSALIKSGFFLLPLLLAGITLGIQTWLLAHVIFPRSADERVARLILAWGVPPIVFKFVLDWVDRARAAVLFGGDAMWTMYLPYVPLFVVAVLGWRLSNRAGIWNDSSDQDPESATR